MDPNRFNDQPCKDDLLDARLLRQEGAHQVLLNSQAESFDYRVSIRRHPDWGTYTIDGMVDFDRSENTDEMVDLINDISRNQFLIYRSMQAEASQQGIAAAFNPEGFLEMGNGRWVYLCAAMASYNTNEYAFDFRLGAETFHMQQAVELIHREMRLCDTMLRAACRALVLVRRGEPPDPLTALSSPPDAVDPLVIRFVDRNRTRESADHTREAHRYLQLGDAHLLKSESTCH
jgi:hypothetical protein